MRRTKYTTQYGYISGGSAKQSLYPMRTTKWFKKLHDTGVDWNKDWRTDNAKWFKKESDYVTQKNSNHIKAMGGNIDKSLLNIKQYPSRTEKKILSVDNIKATKDGSKYSVGLKSSITNIRTPKETLKTHKKPTLSMLKKLKLN